MRMHTIGWFLLVLAGVSAGLGAESAISAPLPALASAVQGQALVITPPRDHHFNAEAPASVKAAGRSLKHTLVRQQLSIPLAPSAADRDVQAEVYLCNDAKTYCKKTSQIFRVPAGTVSAKAESDVKSPRAKTARAARPHLDAETGFIVNDPDKAFKLATKKKLPLLIDFFGIWCPPCNHLDAMVFNSREFKARNAKRFVHLKLDADHDEFNSLKARYKIQALPTVVFTTPAGDEIFRLVGFHPLDEMMAKSDAAYASREEGYAALEALASDGNAEARYKAARIALDRGEPSKALELLLPLKDLLAAAKDSRLAEFYRAQFGAAQEKSDQKLARKTLEQWLKDFPSAPEALEGYENLADLLDEEGDKDGAKDAIRKSVALADQLLAQPTKLKGSYYSEADVAQTRAHSIERQGDPAKAQAAFQACADAYGKEAKEEGTVFPRGPNLERAYCLGKAGKREEAEAIYRDGIKRFPTEYTFYQGLAKLWLESTSTDAAKALPEARKALENAYGNQRLKATMTLARALESAQQLTQAVEAIETELRSSSTEGAIASTLKMRDRLKAKADELRKKAATAIQPEKGPGA